MYSILYQYLDKKGFAFILLITLSSVLLLSVHNHDIKETDTHYSDCPLCYFLSISIDTPIPTPVLFFTILCCNLLSDIIYFLSLILISVVDTRAPPFSYPLN
jgi:hypothetical protein